MFLRELGGVIQTPAAATLSMFNGRSRISSPPEPLAASSRTKPGRRSAVIPPEEHAAKIAAARDAIGDADFFLIARTDARGPNGLDDAIYRANLYYEAGADACFVEAPRNDEELREIGRRTKGIRICNMIEGGITPLHTPAELKAMGFHVVEHCLTTLYAATRGMTEVLSILKETGTTRGALHKLATFEEFNKMIDLDSWNEIEARFSKYKAPGKALE